MKLFVWSLAGCFGVETVTVDRHEQHQLRQEEYIRIYTRGHKIVLMMMMVTMA